MDQVIKAPREGFSGLKEHWQTDLPAALWVFMISLPISMGIAIMSGFPVTSGILSAAIGAIFLTFLSSSSVSIKAPSITMITLVYMAVHQLGSHPEKGVQYTLVVIVLAGLIQVFLGLIRAGHWFVAIPSAVVYGLILSIGVHILIISLPDLLGISVEAYQMQDILVALVQNVWEINTSVAFIGLASLFILIFPSLFRYNFEGHIPGVFIILLVGVILSFYFGLPQEPASEAYLVQVPERLSQIFIFPDFSVHIWPSIHWPSLYYALSIALLGTLESLLNIKSIEAIDVYRRRCLMNRELMVIGVGNILCGLVGAVPLISTMENSSVNVNQGALTRWSSLYQGVFLIIVLLVIYPLFQYIPLATLTAIVVYTAYKFNSPEFFRNLREIGPEQIVIFLSTGLIAFIFGVLWGILGGIVITLVIYLILGSSFACLFRTRVDIIRKNPYKVKVSVFGAALATNYLVIRRKLNQVIGSEKLIIDLSKTKVVDHNFLELIYYFAHLHGLNDGRIELQGLKNHHPLSKHPLATLRVVRKRKARTPNTQERLDERQIDIQGVASVNNARLEVNLTYDGVALQGFYFARGYEIRYRENKFMKFHRSNPMEFSDVFLSKGIRMSEQSFKMSVLLVTVVEVAVPDFYLTTEDLVDKVLQSVGYEDIDFEEHPEFSEKYMLNGEKRDEIRRFFTADLIAFLEKNPRLNIEVSNNRMAFYQEKSLMSRIELEDAIDFIEGLLDVVTQQEEIFAKS